MKKTLLMMLISVITITAYSQDYKDRDYYYYDGIENYKSITSEQKREILKIKKNIGKRHAEIGRNRSLRGYEKGEAHRKLNQEIRKEIHDILNTDQRVSWDSSRKDWYYNNKSERDDDLEDRIEAIEDEIDRLEDYYDDLIDDVEDDKSLPKSVRKAREKELEREFELKERELKRQKQELKAEKNRR